VKVIDRAGLPSHVSVQEGTLGDDGKKSFNLLGSNSMARRAWNSGVGVHKSLGHINNNSCKHAEPSKFIVGPTLPGKKQSLIPSLPDHTSSAGFEMGSIAHGAEPHQTEEPKLVSDFRGRTVS